MDQGNTFEKRVLRTRELLGKLPSGVARKLAYENVIRLFKIPIAPSETTR